MAQLGNSIFVAYIELGTTYSCYAFASRQDIEGDPLRVNMSTWQGSRLLSIKAPTALLLTKDRRFKAFGYEAENQFSEVLEHGDQDDYYYFHQFKMLLQNQSVTRSTQIKETTGKSMEASKVCSIAIKFLKCQVMRTIQERIRGVLRDDDIYFVLTVPAIWSDDTKQLMREAAGKAGINGEKVAIVSEPGAALVYFDRREVHVNSYPSIGRKALVLGIDEEAIQITVFEKKSLQVCQIAHGEVSLGNLSISTAFLQVLTDIFGQTILEEFKRQDEDDYFEFLKEFEKKAKMLSRNSDRDQRIALFVPVSLTDLITIKHQNVMVAIERSFYKTKMFYYNQKLRMEPDLLRSLLKRINEKLESFLRRTLSHPELKGITDLIMVGDDCECGFFQETCRKLIGKSVKLVSSREAVIKGAILYGYGPVKEVKSETLICLTTDDCTQLAAQATVEKCVVCDKKGIFYCLDCKSVYCQKCRITHDKIPSSKQHNIMDLKIADRTATTATNALCLLHKQEFVFACSDCSVLICAACVTSEHTGHRISDIKTVVLKIREDAQKQVSRMKNHLRKLESEVSTIKTLNLGSTVQKAFDDLKEIEGKINAAVKRRVAFRYNEIDDVLQLQREEIKYDLRKKERTLAQQQAVLHSMERLLSETSDIPFFTTSKVLQNEIVDVNDVMGSPITSEVKELDETSFVQDTINTIVSTFDMSVVATNDGKAVLKKNKPSVKRFRAQKRKDKN